MAKNKGIKFEFTSEFQEDLLRFTLTDRVLGPKVVALYEYHYFTLLQHNIIAYALKKYFKKNRKIPSKSILLEELREVYLMQEYAEHLTKEDTSEINGIVKDLYSKHAEDGLEILKKAEKFAQFVELKDLVENADLTNYHEYSQLSQKVQKAVAPKLKQKKDEGTYLIKDIKNRQAERQTEGVIIPTPFKQINDLTNAGGYERGSIIVIVDRPKKFKTGAMVNIIRGYLKRKYKIAVFDLENGQDGFTLRLEQSIMNKNKRELMSGQYDKEVQKRLRKYKRLGGEVFIKRMPAFSTANDFRAVLDEQKRENNFEPEILIIDYLGLMAAISGKIDDHNRISDAYLDIANLANERDIIHTWTPHHVKADAYKKRATRYESNDLAKCTEIGRHVHAMFGLNRSEEEVEQGVMRMELIEQRDGLQEGRALFMVKEATQVMTEFTSDQRKLWNENWAGFSGDKLSGYNTSDEGNDKIKKGGDLG